MAIVTTDSKHYTNIANAIREKIGLAETFTPAQMPYGIEGVYQRGYGHGYTKGEAGGIEIGRELGKQAEYDRFWDVYQDEGNRTDYSSSFRGSTWTDEIYAPKHDIVASKGATYMFNNSRITSTKVNITVHGNIGNMFSYDPSLVTIPLLTFVDITSCTDTFRNCKNLENVTFGGSFGISGLDLHWSTKLTKESILSLFGILENFTGTGTTRTLTIGTENLAKLTEEEKDIARLKGWTLPD